MTHSTDNEIRDEIRRLRHELLRRQRDRAAKRYIIVATKAACKAADKRIRLESGERGAR